MAITQYVLFTVLSAELPANLFLQTLRQARARHMALAITGAMLFDGEAALCLIQGEPDALGQARLALTQGLPSTVWQALHQGAVQGERLFKDWRVGYTEPEAVLSLCGSWGDVVDESAQARPLTAFERLVNASDPL